LEQFKDYLDSIEPLQGILLNAAIDRPGEQSQQGKSFWVLKIKVREKIVADGIRDPGFSMEKKGKYVNAVEMNELLRDEETIVIDMRNHYEYEVGHFEQADGDTKRYFQGTVAHGGRNDAGQEG
jgi:UPF0176 protein